MLSSSVVVSALEPLAGAHPVEQIEIMGLGETHEDLVLLGTHMARVGALTDDIAADLEMKSPGDRQVVAAAYLAAGGSRDRMTAALRMLGVDTLVPRFSPAVLTVWGVLGTLSMAASAFHGYRRNQSVGWALWWGLMGATFPVITPTIALAQGFGVRKR